MECIALVTMMGMMALAAVATATAAAAAWIEGCDASLGILWKKLNHKR